VSKSSIEWTEATWNPVVGCTVLSPGCTNCYAMRLASRLAAMGQEKYAGTTRVSGGRPKWNGRITLDRRSLDLPISWKKGRMIFVNSMSDLFHEEIPLDYIQEVFEVMRATPQHIYQVLTKRAENLQHLAPELPWPDNVWMGVSVERADYVWRIDHLRLIPAAVRFVSLGPLLGPLDQLDLDGIDWAIAGGESGPGARPMRAEWVRSIAISAFGMALLFTSSSGAEPTRSGRDDCSTDAYGTNGPRKAPGCPSSGPSLHDPNVLHRRRAMWRLRATPVRRRAPPAQLMGRQSVPRAVTAVVEPSRGEHWDGERAEGRPAQYFAPWELASCHGHLHFPPIAVPPSCLSG
jgi:protein gp37